MRVKKCECESIPGCYCCPDFAECAIEKDVQKEYEEEIQHQIEQNDKRAKDENGRN